MEGVGSFGGEDGEDDVAAAAGEAHDGGIVTLALGAFAVVVGAAVGAAAGRNAAMNMAFLRRWFPRRQRLSLLRLVPDCRVTGASPV